MVMKFRSGGINKQQNCKEAKLKSDRKSWSLTAGILTILAACILAYLLTKPADADAALLYKTSSLNQSK